MHLLDLLDMKSALQTLSFFFFFFQLGSRFCVSPLPSCSHGNRAVKEGAEEHEVWEMTNTWPHCFRDRAELALNVDIDCRSAILTSNPNVQAIRQKLCGTQRSRDERVSVSVGEGQSP